jgi:hypothetical protein
LLSQERSTLYSVAPGGALRRLVVLATAALEPVVS